MITATTFECTAKDADSLSSIKCTAPGNLPTWLEYIGPIFTALAALVALITLVVLLVDSNRRSRPYLEAKLEAGFWGLGSADLIMINSGTTPAREIEIACKELDEATSATAMELKRYFSKNRILRPGERIRLVWNHQPEGVSFESGKLVDPLKDIPEIATLNISYRGQKLNGSPTRFSKPYRETFHLDATFKSVSPSATGLPDRDAKDMSKNHKDIRQGFELIARQISELRR